MRPSGDPARRNPKPLNERLWKAGRLAWALLGLAGILVLLGYLASLLWFAIVPVVLALFPATLLVPVASELKERGVPNALAALLTMVCGILLFVAVVGSMVPLVTEEIPEITASASEGVGELNALLGRISPALRIEGPGALMEAAREQIGEAGNVAAQTLEAVTSAFETLAAALLLLVVLFFYLKDGRALLESLVSVLPSHLHARANGIADRSWSTLGSYFRGQLLVALVDAVFIGVGLWILGVPLVLPLALLIFFGGLFPIIGAVVTGSLAVLVALADGGLTIGLLTAGLVLLVQQLEGNVLEPLILGHVIRLHPLVIILSITAGWLILGLLGAFLAVPLAAITARTVTYLKEEGSTEEDPSPEGSAAG